MAVSDDQRYFDRIAPNYAEDRRRNETYQMVGSTTKHILYRYRIQIINLEGTLGNFATTNGLNNAFSVNKKKTKNKNKYVKPNRKDPSTFCDERWDFQIKP